MENQSIVVVAPVPLCGWAKRVAQFSEHLADERNVSEHTSVAYRTDLTLAFYRADPTGEKPPEHYTADYLRETIHSVVTRKGAPLGPRSIARKYSALKTFYRWLIQEGVSARFDPSSFLITPEQPLRRPKAMDVDGAITLMDPPPSADPAGRRDHAALLLMYGLGLRRSEVVALALADVDLAGRAARIQGRGRKLRHVPIPKGCVPGLQAWVESRPCVCGPAFIVGPSGNSLSARTIGRLVQRAAERAAGRHITPRQLRHSFATHLLQDGANLHAIQNLLGHAQLVATQSYSQVEVTQLTQTHRGMHPRGAPSSR